MMKKTKLQKVLQKALIGESLANRRYLVFAKKAEEEGHEETASLFREIAKEETEHAQELYELIGIGDTRKNIKEAIKDERKEKKKIYPSFAERAKSEGNEAAASRFTELAGDEAKHLEKLQQALRKLKKSKTKAE